MGEGSASPEMPITIKPPENIGWQDDEPTEIATESFQEGLIKPGDKVLDVGSGSGRNANWLAQQGVEVTAINNDPKEIEGAQKKAEALGVNVNYLLGSATELHFPDNSFEVVLDGGCTHEIPDKEGQKKAEAETARVIKLGGHLIYFGFSKEHPDYVNKKDSPQFRDLKDVQEMYGQDFEIISSKEVRWAPKPEEERKFPEHVGLIVVMKRKEK
jgi:ubiquinone/menaquinone biosynthesis C-methylase UbiE